MDSERYEGNVQMSIQGASLWEQFKSHYPRRNGCPLVGQAVAKKLFLLLDEADQADCVRAAKHYAKYCKGDGIEWRPSARDPERFLRSKSYDYWRDWVQGPAVVCNFRMTPACSSAVMDGTETCEFHASYRAKLAARRA
jgi:hypothetical protein